MPGQEAVVVVDPHVQVMVDPQVPEHQVHRQGRGQQLPQVGDLAHLVQAQDLGTTTLTVGLLLQEHMVTLIIAEE